MRLAASALASAALLGGAGHSSGGSLIVFAADRAPAISGDVYRVDASGRVVNLAHSPWQETQPLVSPNGKLVAFLSDRAGGSLWVVGVDGRGRRRLPAIALPSHQYVETAWSPDSRSLAVVAATVRQQVLFVTGPGRASRAIVRGSQLVSPAWSPDGRLVTVATTGGVDAFTPAGKHVWDISSRGAVIGWSPRGLFATGAYSGRVHVVDERGAERFSVAATRAAWSPDGAKLATMKGHRGNVYSSAGRLLSSRTVAAMNAQPVWTSATHVVFGFASLGLNTVRTGSTFAVRDGTHVYTHVGGCGDDGGPVAAIESLQRVPRSASIVYASHCAEPLDNLYTVAPDGSGLRRITNVQKHQVEPALSPDATRISYAQSDATGLSCKGCPSALRTMPLSGSAGVALTFPPDCTFDGSPSWSPDGTQIVYSDGSCDTAPHLLVVAATGGAPKDLHLPGSQVAWGPARIAYLDGSTVPSSIWTVNPDGSGRTKVGAGNVFSPAWSADGRLAYLAGTAVVVQGTKVPLPFAQVRSLRWSPDGTRFVVVAKMKTTPTFDVYTLRTDGTGVQRLTRNVDASSADWR